MLNYDDVYNHVSELLQAEYHVDMLEGKTFDNAKHFKLDEDLDLDSLDVVELAMDVEDRFDIELDDSTLEELTTIGLLVEHIVIEVT